jgi:hypothetical protein
VEGGHQAVVFNKLFGVKKKTYGPGTHFRIPWLEKVVIFDVRSKPRTVPSLTGSNGKSELNSTHFTKRKPHEMIDPKKRSEKFLFLFYVFRSTDGECDCSCVVKTKP